jgi:hypothetical protein
MGFYRRSYTRDQRQLDLQMDSNALRLGDSMNSFDKRKLVVENRWLNFASGILILCMCLLQMSTMWALLQRHWSSLLGYQHTVAITVLILYPVPCLHFFRRFQTNATLRFLLVLLTYILLSLTTSLIFH